MSVADENNSTTREVDDDVYADIVWTDDWVGGTSHEKVHLILIRIAGFVTMLSAICILMETAADVRASRRNRNAGNSSRRINNKKYSATCMTVTRMLLAMQLGQILVGTTLGIGVWAAPSFIPDAWSAKGTIFTCELTGFFVYLGSLVLMLYDSSLSILYLLIDYSDHILWILLGSV